VGKRAFLGLDFDVKSHDEWLDLLAHAGETRPFRYLATPNVDHLICYHEGLVPAHVYEGADYKVCDSRILAALAKLRGVDLAPYPGSDMVGDFLASPASRSVRICLLGPTREDFERLKTALPAHQLLWIEAPIMKPGSPEWTKVLAQLMETPFDLLLCCISFPKQEIMCHDLRLAGRDRGLAIGAGASLDFLTGRQVRAPRWMMALHLEWLYRLLSDPKRLWHRYLVRGPRVFLLFLRHR
jgi:exopolysaccharide biosynthesis WecB/TagA/CpsF family protein